MRSRSGNLHGPPSCNVDVYSFGSYSGAIEMDSGGTYGSRSTGCQLDADLYSARVIMVSQRVVQGG